MFQLIFLNVRPMTYVIC